MGIMQGRVKLHRQIQENCISTNLELLGLFSYILTKANHQSNSFFIGNTKVELLPGQFIRSVRGISERFGLSIGKSQRLLKRLEEEKILIHKGYTKYSLFTVVNRDKYQGCDTQIDTQIDTQTIHKQTTNKNDKNDKNEKEIISSDFFDLFRMQYPRKVDKAKSKLAFDKHIKAGVDPQAIIKGAKQYAISQVGIESQFIKHPPTRLNGRNWEDEIEVNTTKVYELYLADGRTKETKRLEYCAKYTEPIMLQAQRDYNTKQQQLFNL